MMATELEKKIAAAIAHVAEAGSGLEPAAPQPLAAAGVAQMIDHTVLKPDTTLEMVQALCAEARAHNFASVCVNATWAPLCVAELAGSDVKVCVVAGFPLGATLPAVKAFEAKEVVALGAAEVDMVLNVGALRSGDVRLVWEDVAGVADECHDAGAILKVIIETHLLTQEEKIAACVIAKDAGADFVKTSTGFSGGGATVEDVALMRYVVGPEVGVKASGGVRTAADALAVIAAGATRIGTSGGVRIMAELTGESETAARAADGY
jgi:deoxyribose-phosphate aldolase